MECRADRAMWTGQTPGITALALGANAGFGEVAKGRRVVPTSVTSHFLG
jgi:hypothetical protein